MAVEQHEKQLPTKKNSMASFSNPLVLRESKQDCTRQSKEETNDFDTSWCTYLNSSKTELVWNGPLNNWIRY